MTGACGCPACWLHGVGLDDQQVEIMHHVAMFAYMRGAVAAARKQDDTRQQQTAYLLTIPPFTAVDLVGCVQNARTALASPASPDVAAMTHQEGRS